MHATDDLALRCPHCGAGLRAAQDVLTCADCGTAFDVAPSGQVDLSLQRPKPVTATFVVGTPMLPPEPVPVVRFDERPAPAVARSAPPNVAAGFAAAIPVAPTASARALDIGCANASMAGVFDALGYDYTGMDLVDPRAPIRADVHAIPFADETFDVVWSGSMLQYTAHPALAVREVARVLKPGGWFVGSVAFLEAFDGDNRVLFTQDGTIALLYQAGFDVRGIYPDRWWTGLTAIGTAGLFPRLPVTAVRALMSPIAGLSRIWWALASRRRPDLTAARRISKVTALYGFVARRPDAPPG